MRKRANQAFYRSQTVRVAFLLSGGAIAYYLSPFAPPSWHETPSLQLIHHLMPWWLMSAPFVVYTLLLVGGTVKAAVVANAIGMVAYTAQLVALILVAREKIPVLIDGSVQYRHVWNLLVMVACALVVVMHYAAMRLAIIADARSAEGLQ